MVEFAKFVFTPAGMADASLAVCASRAGGIGVLNTELTTDFPPVIAALEVLATQGHGPYGLKVDVFAAPLTDAITAHAARGMKWLIVESRVLDEYAEMIPGLRAAGIRVLVEVTTADAASLSPAVAVDGLLIKGNEAGGFVGEDSSYILLQKFLRASSLPLYVRGGLTPYVAAACAALGVVGGAFDSQLLLMDEVRLPESLTRLISNLSGTETIAVGNPETGEYFRMLVRPALTAARQFVTDGEDLTHDELKQQVVGHASWSEPARGLLPVGQDVAFAAPWRKRFGTVAAVLRAVDLAVTSQPRLALNHESVVENSSLARAWGTRLPIIQGPMTRVSDTAPFARAVADSGALPMVALAVMKGAPLAKLLAECAELLGDRPWGVGLLGFAPQELLDEQFAIAAKSSATYAIIAGGRPDQAVQLERAGIPSFLHVPSANLIPLFLREGARRFIFEGRECGGHIGPLSSFVLWTSAVERLLAELPACKVAAEDVEIIFAGGIHDDVSSAMVQIIAAPLAAAGAKIGVLMGSAYLFTREIVESGSIVEQYQKEVLECAHTVNLESGVGHASRCAYTPFARDFFLQRAALRREGLAGDQRRNVLDELILGRLRVASKGMKRSGSDGALRTIADADQHAEGMYMLGQVATLRHSVTDLASLHLEVTAGAAHLIAESVGQVAIEAATAGVPCDIAVVGMACALPKANGPQEFWNNIVAKVDAITEIPAHRWDWRIYFDEDRDAKDKIYSKWGGFLDDLPFEPLSYGMPPKSIDAVDPMQLMGLEIARRTLVDSGYSERPFDRERASVIIGASGGIGDVGMQYGLRSELPRFIGTLPEEVAKRLPVWTEDSFAGILPNVAAGRIANRLNFGGINLTTDAACASSLAAIYQAVTELTAGRSDFVIAGGVDTVQGPFGYLCFSKTQALSPRGKCSTFDAAGDGIAISEGIAMVALKRLSDAQRDGDRIYCVIKGVGASSDGRAKGLTAPLPAGQLRAMRRAYEMAGFPPSSVGLFEAHGTGTVVGDGAEVDSTTKLIQEHTPESRQAVIGSVKTMIGHTKATAGAAGLMKAALALRHRVLPPHINVTKPIDALFNKDAPLYLLDEAMPWLATPGQPRRAACSAFGFGGTNFHVVLEEYTGEYREWLQPAASDVWGAELLLWSGKDVPALISRIEGFVTGLPQLDGLQLRDVAATLALDFRPGGHVVAVVARTLSEVPAKLAPALSKLRGEKVNLPPGISVGDAAQRLGKVAVLFSGQGSQYPGMLRETALHFNAVSDALSAADEVLRQEFATRFGSTRTLSRFIFPRGCYDEAAQSTAREQLASTDVAQPALGAVETGLFRLMQSLGLQADMFAGHSFGEFTALHAAGAIDFESLMQLAAARGRFIVDAARAEGAELGTMAAVSGLRSVVEDQIAGIEGIVLANHNAPLQSVISGTRAGIASAIVKLREMELNVTEIPVAAAFHSSLVQPAQRALGAMIEKTPWAAVGTPVYSNTTARLHSMDCGEVRQQMTEHLVKPVEFVSEIEAMYADGARIFIEIGPKSVLAKLTTRILGQRPNISIATDEGGGIAGLLAGIGRMLCAGIELDVSRLFARRDCRTGDLQRPASLSRRLPMSDHAWLLNGSAARRASAPPRQVGVTFEQAALVTASAAAAQIAAPAVAAPEAAVPTQPSPVATASRQIAPALPQSPTRPLSIRTVRRKDRPMDDRPNESSVLYEYFETMRQFLATQERVINAYLGADGAVRQAAPPKLLPSNAARASELAAAPVIRPTAKAFVPPPAAVAPPPVKAAAPVAATPPAAPAPAPAPAAPAPAPVAAKPATNGAHKTNGTNGANGNGGAAFSREKLQDVLLGIVEEKTGYPRDILGLDQNLEADLGIDSIKRVEVVGAFLDFLPPSYREALTRSGAKLSTKSSLNGMLDLIAQTKTDGAATGPFELAGAGVEADYVSHPPRLILRSQSEPLLASMERRLTFGHFVITRDHLGVAEALSARLRGHGVPVTVLDPAQIASEAAVMEFARSLGATPIAGLVHLAAVGAPAVTPEQGVPEWRAAIQANEKSFFLLLRELSPALAPAAHVVAACGLGGLFGRDAAATGELQLQGGAPGTLKSLLQEREDLRAKAIDLDPTRNATELCADLMAEIELVGGRQEVGYPAGRRTVFHTVADTVRTDQTRETNLKNIVVLATGGMRGITAEVLREIAKPGNTLILTGRSALPQAEAAETAELRDAAALRAYYVALLRSGTVKMTVGDIGKKVQSVLDLREMFANIADFRAAGAAVEYHAVDVTNETALRALIATIEQTHQRIDGVVHGAGVIEDKLLADKTSDSWSRVIETKLIGLLLLQKLLNPRTLRFFTIFSSVAGRYGNSGQIDYATANELMNRAAVALQARWGADVAVSALCWGPWGPTKFGAGMVTAETKAKFAERGVYLVSAELGRRLFRQELTRTAGSAVEVICGQGPWESEEVRRGVIQHAPEAPPPPNSGPLLASLAVATDPTGKKVVTLQLNSKQGVRVADGAAGPVDVLPPALALEMFAEAARQIWPQWVVVEIRDFRVRRQLELEGAARSVRIQLSPPPYGSSEGFEVSASLSTDADGVAETCFECVLGLQLELPATPVHRRASHVDRPLDIAEAYDKWLARDARLRIIEKVDGLSGAGAGAIARTTEPAKWLAGGAARDSRWLFDPGLLDAAAQMISLWTRSYLSEHVVPVRYGRVVRFTDKIPARLHVEFTRADSPGPEFVRGNVTFFDEQGQVVLAIEDLDCAVAPSRDGSKPKPPLTQGALA